MYLSTTYESCNGKSFNSSNHSDYIIAIELEENFFNYLKDAHEKIATSKLDVDLLRLNFDKSKARILESFCPLPYEDRRVYNIAGGEDPLYYYGWVVDRHYFPKEEYWEETVPDNVYLEYYSNSFGFTFTTWKHSIDSMAKFYGGYAISLNDWEVHTKE